MSEGLRIDKVVTLQTFDNDYKKLSPEVKQYWEERLPLLYEHPIPKKMRFEKLHGYKNLSLYTVHVTPNHSHKVSMEIQGSKAILRRIGTHKKIDKTP